MLYYFYHLYYTREVEKDDEGKSIKSTFDIGYFSSKSKAEKQIQLYKDLPGFKDYPIDCFVIKKLGVRFNNIVKDKSLVDLYVLSHEYEDEEGYEYPTIFYPFSTELEAINERKMLKSKKPFCDYPDDFIIGIWSVDRDIYWDEGFFTY